jgi:hypothetical protein
MHHGDERWFPQRNLYVALLSVRAWQNIHAISKTSRYGGAWLKGGSGALNWPKGKIHSCMIAESERKAAFAGIWPKQFRYLIVPGLVEKIIREAVRGGLFGAVASLKIPEIPGKAAALFEY